MLKFLENQIGFCERNDLCFDFELGFLESNPPILGFLIA